jgi:hypothetical protein
MRFRADRRSLILKLSIALLAWCGVALSAEPPPPPGSETTPPRLAFIDGAASLWRSGAHDWLPARVNTPLAPGDRLYIAERANLEIQIGARAFVRAAERTELGLANLEPDFLQLELKSGTASLDLRSLAPGHTVELDTPNAVFTIEHPGYYRAAIDGDRTYFITRRAGRATISLEGGMAHTISPSEEIVVSGAEAPTVATYVAPALDAWDRWNYARTDHEIEALSARYMSPGVYGAGVLDQYGSWRVVGTYGPVWVPDRSPPGWAPYSSGSWIWDPYYGWTWVDDAPWGWAPFHYGRWVFINSYWAWAPGPVIVRPVYAPALVAFFGVAPGVSVSIGIGAVPAVSWVALGWGEPLIPWWGRPGFVGEPWWGGWGGPRVATGVHHHTRIAVIAVAERNFGGPVRARPFRADASHKLEPVRGALPVRPGPASVAAASGKTVRPPPAAVTRSVVTTRPPREQPKGAAAPRVVTPPAKRPEASAALPRPQFGSQGQERPRPAQPQRYEQFRKAPGAASAGPSAKPPPQGSRALPGRPANEVRKPAARKPGAGEPGPRQPSGR